MIPPKLETVEEYLALYLLVYGEKQLQSGTTMPGEMEFLYKAAQVIYPYRDIVAGSSDLVTAMRGMVDRRKAHDSA